MLGLDIAYMRAKFEHSSFSRFGDMVGNHQNLNGSRDLTTTFQGWFLVENRQFEPTSPLISAPVWGDPVGILRRFLAIENYRVPVVSQGVVCNFA